MRIDFNLRDELAEAFADASDFARLKEPNETKQQFTTRMLKRYAKDIAKAYIVRAASEVAVTQAQVAVGLFDD